MPPPLSSLYTLSFLLALLSILLIAATLRLLAILPSPRTAQQWRKPPPTTRVLIVLGSGGHTHEMFYLLKDLDTSKYTHRTYVVSSGDAFSAQRAVEFEQSLERKHGRFERLAREQRESGQDKEEENTEKSYCVGPTHYNISVIPRARKIHQPLFTTPLSSLLTLYHSFAPLLSVPSTATNTPSTTYDLPGLILTNGPATGVILILASLVLKFFDIRGAHSRRKCKTLYVESFARVKGLSLSGKLVVRVVDRFLVQWEGLEGSGGRAEYWGVLV